MRDSSPRHFDIALLISLIIHIFALTILFTTPKQNASEDYREIKIRLGSNQKTVEKNRHDAQILPQILQATPSAGTISPSQPPEPKTIDQGIKLESRAETKPPEKLKPAKTKISALHKKDHKNNGEQTEPHAGLDTPYIPLQEASLVDSESEPSYTIGQENPSVPPGNILGNSYSTDTESIASYEQILPLWLNKFKKHPSGIEENNLSGTGEIFIKIDRNGKILLSRIIKTTGSETLDKSLMQMLKDADPVVPVPPIYHPDKKTFSYKIEFEFKNRDNNE